MKATLILLAMLLSSTSFARIVSLDHRYYIETNGKEEPIYLLNSLIEKKAVKTIKIYGGGNINVISFAKNNGPEQLYSIDEKGYMYAIEPFSKYKISKIHNNNLIQFAEAPNKRFFINSQGYYIYK